MLCAIFAFLSVSTSAVISMCENHDRAGQTSVDGVATVQSSIKSMGKVITNPFFPACNSIYLPSTYSIVFQKKI